MKRGKDNTNGYNRVEKWKRSEVFTDLALESKPTRSVKCRTGHYEGTLEGSSPSSIRSAGYNRGVPGPWLCGVSLSSLGWAYEFGLEDERGDERVFDPPGIGAGRGREYSLSKSRVPCIVLIGRGWGCWMDATF